MADGLSAPLNKKRCAAAGIVRLRTIKLPGMAPGLVPWQQSTTP